QAPLRRGRRGRDGRVHLDDPAPAPVGLPRADAYAAAGGEGRGLLRRLRVAHQHEERSDMAHVVNLADVPEVVIGAARWLPLNQRLGITHFGINGTVLDPGEDPDIDHDEAEGGEQEAYIVVTGRARFRLGDDHVDVGPGTVVAVPDPT